MKIYFYNGFDKPELIAASLNELKNNCAVSDNYLGDKTEEFREELKEFSKHPEFYDGINDALGSYNIIVDPTLKELINWTTSWFGWSKTSFPFDYLSDFGSKDEIYTVLKKERK